MDELLMEIEKCRESLIDTIFRFDFESCKGLLIFQEEVDELFDYREGLQEIKDKIRKYDKDYIIKYLNHVNKKYKLIHGACMSRLKRVKQNPLDIFDNDIPERILNMNT